MILRRLRRKWQREFRMRVARDERLRRELDRKLRALEVEAELWRRTHERGGRA